MGLGDTPENREACLQQYAEGVSPAAMTALQPLLFCVAIACVEDPTQACLTAAVAADGDCAGQAGQCLSPCVPRCAGRACGDDGCGGLCGLCPPGEDCAGGVCGLCEPSCGTHDCGGDGCGDPCGSCPPGYSCLEGYCTAGCTAQCEGRVCGSDLCGGSCGDCPEGQGCEGGQCCEWTSCREVIGCLMECIGITQAPYFDCLATCAATASPGAVEQMAPMSACVMGACGPHPDAGCTVSAVTAGECRLDFAACLEACVPDCRGRFCGTDGCGGSCGDCGYLATCTDWGKCVPCVPRDT